MKRTLALSLIALFAIPGLSEEPVKASASRPVCKLSKTTLKVTFAGKTEIIKDVFSSKNPTEQWNPEDLVSPDGKQMVVPMADSTHRYYVFHEGEIVLEGTIEGGIAWGGGSFYRGRQHWHFTSWRNADTLGLIGDKMSQEEPVQANLKFEDDGYLSFSTVSKGDGERSLSLRLVFPGGEGEVPFRYREPEKAVPQKESNSPGGKTQPTAAPR